MFNEPLANPTHRTGWIEVITGPMFSGKTEELIRRLRRAQFADQRIEIYHPLSDTRTGDGSIKSHDNLAMLSLAVSDADAILTNTSFPDVLGIDECQFFDRHLVKVANELADRGVRVIAAGLDMDYSRKPFGPMPELMTSCEVVTKMHAVCMRCGNPASFSFRKSGQKKQILVGAAEHYEPLCRKCFLNE